jgi:hypothetical protein
VVRNPRAKLIGGVAPHLFIPGALASRGDRVQARFVAHPAPHVAHAERAQQVKPNGNLETGPAPAREQVQHRFVDQRAPAAGGGTFSQVYVRSLVHSGDRSRLPSYSSSSDPLSTRSVVRLL